MRVANETKMILLLEICRELLVLVDIYKQGAEVMISRINCVLCAKWGHNSTTNMTYPGSGHKFPDHWFGALLQTVEYKSEWTGSIA